MPGMMRWSCSRGCCVRDDRPGEKRELTHWLDEYETDPETVVPDDECPRDLRPCPIDTRDCCTGDEPLRRPLGRARNEEAS